LPIRPAGSTIGDASRGEEPRDIGRRGTTGALSLAAMSGQPAPPRPFAAYGARSMTAPLIEALVQRPGRAFGRAFSDPAHGFLHAVDLDLAQREHDAFTALLRQLGVVVHDLGSDGPHPDL
jgi:hypothetical protein